MGMPLRRHHSYSFAYGRFYEGMESTVLILRTIAVIINYDYVIDFMFYLTELCERSGLFLLVTYLALSILTMKVNTASNFMRILQLTYIQHLFNFKVDLHSKGTSNRFATANIKTEDTEQVFEKDAKQDAEDLIIVHFQNFIDDNESIVDEDLVAWVTMGIHHIHHTEDLPVTPTPGMGVSFYLLPYNYFDEDPAISSLNAVRIEPRIIPNLRHLLTLTVMASNKVCSVYLKK
ncbi:ABP1 [Mytilus edulis]|uniref:Amine oxidase n=1 Tax=Mytilus edulis TaxID=6550 RepID=A0A8S3SZW6_MYTED|nr:ABP1 [Mytilus edulis]